MPTAVVLKTLDVAPEPLAALASVLSPGEQARAERLRLARDRRRFIACRGYLRELVAERLDCSPAAVAFRYGAHGKPATAGIEFNLSHSGDLAVYAFSDYAIGVDVEAVAPDRDLDALAARCFSRVENETYEALAPAARPLAFFNCWTRKEAFVKAVGDGLSMSLDAFDVTLAPGEPARLLRVGSIAGDESGWSLQSFAPAPGYVAAVVQRAC
jgi:4'-phosphopantetheinyl transferase